jgi:hypothetical protein
MGIANEGGRVAHPCGIGFREGGSLLGDLISVLAFSHRLFPLLTPRPPVPPRRGAQTQAPRRCWVAGGAPLMR